MRTLLLALFQLWAVPWAVFWTGFVSALYVAVSLVARPVAWMDFCQRLHSRGLLPLIGVRVEVRGAENFTGDTAIVMANHSSLIDIPVMTGHVPMIRFVAKKELGRIPVFGWALIRSETVLIDRFDRKSAVEGLQRMAQVFGKGRNVMVFAEGTRTRDGRLQPLKKGGFHLAMDTGLPILPVSIDGTRRVLPRGGLLLQPGKVILTVHPPIPVEGTGREEIPALMTRVRDTLLTGLPEAAAAEAPGATAAAD